jgi:hypothetical protein
MARRPTLPRSNVPKRPSSLSRPVARFIYVPKKEQQKLSPSIAMIEGSDYLAQIDGSGFLARIIEEV